MGNGWATQHPATAANASSSEAAEIGVSSHMREQPQTAATPGRHGKEGVVGSSPTPGFTPPIPSW